MKKRILTFIEILFLAVVLIGATLTIASINWHANYEYCTITVESGDTLSGLANQYIKPGQDWRDWANLVAQMNGLRDINAIYAGQQIVVINYIGR